MSENKDNKNKEVYKDDVDDKSFKQPTDLAMSLSIRSYFFQILFFVFTGVYFINLLSKISEKGLRIYDILGKPEVTKSTSKFWLNILSYRFSETSLTYPVYFLIFFSFFMIIYYILLAKTTEYKVNFRSLQITKGVFNRKIDTIDLVAIKDQALERPLMFRLLGLSRLIVISNDKTDPILKISAVDVKKANLFFDYIRQNAYQNATEYWVAKDRRRRNEKRPDSNTPIIGDGDSNE